MPGSTYAVHPSQKISITFTEEDHRYVDSATLEYISSTTLVKSAFAEFDAVAVAERKSLRTGKPALEYLEEWNRGKVDAADHGTRMHENCENHILGHFDKLHIPEDEAERIQFRACFQEVEKIRNRNFLSLQPEKLVFSPRFRVAGSIDLLIQKGPKEYLILDWKRVKQMKFEGFRGKTGTHPATLHLQDCNYAHYSLQLAIYEQILKLEGYIPPDAVVGKFLNVYNRERGAFDHYECMELRYEALLLMAYHNTVDGLEMIPF